MEFKVGEQVSLLHETGCFTVKSHHGLRVVVVDECGFEYRVQSSQLVKRNPMVGQVIPKDTVPTQNKKMPLAKNTTLTLDLHASELGIEGLAPHLLLKEQMKHCCNFLNQCIDQGQTKILIIHGVGEGVLKESVRNMLKNKPGVRFHDGNYSPRGMGSTLVELQWNVVQKF